MMRFTGQTIKENPTEFYEFSFKQMCFKTCWKRKLNAKNS